MKLETFVKPTTATIYFIFFSAFLFSTGYFVGGLKYKVQPREELIASSILGLIPIAAGYLNYFINAKILEESNKKIEENDKKCQDTIQSFAVNYLHKIDHIEIELKQINGPASDKCIIEVQKFKSVVNKYRENYEASRKIMKILDNETERRHILENIIAYARKEYKKVNSKEPLPKEFNRDIGRCVNWLRDSVNLLDTRNLDKSYMTTAIKSNLLKDFTPYEFALKRIIFDEKISKISLSTKIINEYIEYLIKELSK